jgi:hypothetical protein
LNHRETKKSVAPLYETKIFAFTTNPAAAGPMTTNVVRRPPRRTPILNAAADPTTDYTDITDWDHTRLVKVERVVLNALAKCGLAAQYLRLRRSYSPSSSEKPIHLGEQRTESAALRKQKLRTSPRIQHLPDE